MRYSKVKLMCKQCSSEFEVIKTRATSAKYCSSVCYHNSTKGKPTHNKGKKSSKETCDKISKATSGKNNPMYGKTHSAETKRKMSEKKQNFIPANKGKQFPGIFSDIDRTGENNAYIKYILRTENITYSEYRHRMDDKVRYYNDVRNITNLQPIHILENYEKRKHMGDDAYHLDHIYPISKGFENNIPPEIIGDISNLQFLFWKDNLIKSDKL